MGLSAFNRGRREAEAAARAESKRQAGAVRERARRVAERKAEAERKQADAVAQDQPDTQE